MDEAATIWTEFEKSEQVVWAKTVVGLVIIGGA